jgi:hypothetical protein
VTATKPDLSDRLDMAIDWLWIGAAGLVFGVALRLRWPRIILADVRWLTRRRP